MSCNMKFMTFPYLVSDATYTYSSQLTDYPASNAIDEDRGKFWRFDGSWHVGALNDKVYYNDGSDKTATLDHGYYTTTAYRTEVQSKMNTGSTVWECDYSTTTNKFTITRAASPAILRLSESTNAIWDTLGFTGTIDRSGTSLEADEQRNHSSEWIKIDMGGAVVASAACLIGQIDEVFEISVDANVYLQGNNIDDFDDPPYSVELDTTERGAFKFVGDPESYRYWRINIVDRLNPIGQNIAVSNVYIGDSFTPISSNISRGLSKDQTDPTIKQKSESGKSYFDERIKYDTYSSMQIQNISASDRKEIEKIFQNYGLNIPFFVSLDPLKSIEPDINTYTKYVRFTQKPVMNHLFLEYYTVSFNFGEVV